MDESKRSNHTVNVKTTSAATTTTTTRYSRHRHHFNAPSKSRSPSPRIGNGSSVKQLVLSSTSASGILLAAPGYEQYQKSLLEVPLHHAEYGEASSDDLSSEWDSDVPEPPRNSVKVLYIVPRWYLHTYLQTASVVYLISCSS